jgi:chemotaxis signal transduction protein
MKDYIVFTVGSNYYALDVECIERIIQTPPITMIPNTHPTISGMISYEKKVVKVIDFRKMTGMDSYEEELRKLFTQFKQDHIAWVEELKESVEKNHRFTFATDPHTSRFGKWLDSYTTHDEDILAILKILRPMHSKLHEIGREALLLQEKNTIEATHFLRENIDDISITIINGLNKMIESAQMVSEHAQKLLIYRKNENTFAIKVDLIHDIVAIQPSMLKEIERATQALASLETEGVVEIGERLVNVIKSVALPTRGGV